MRNAEKENVQWRGGQQGIAADALDYSAMHGSISSLLLTDSSTQGKERSLVLLQLGLVPHTHLTHTHLLGISTICMDLNKLAKEAESAIQNGVLNAKRAHSVRQEYFP